MFAVETITVVGSIAGAGAILVAGVWKLSKDISTGNGEIYEKIGQVETTARERAENVADVVREDFRDKAVCDERHNTVSNQLETLTGNVEEIHKDIKSLLRKNGIRPTG